MKAFDYKFPFNRRPWNQSWCWHVLAGVAAFIHYVAGASVVFPVLFVIPVLLAAWHGGRVAGVSLGVALSLIRFAFYFAWEAPWSFGVAVLNLGVHALVLVLIALLTAHCADLHRALLQRVANLEGLLPICSFCKRIRDEQGSWRKLEAFISSRTEAQFTHSVCPKCAKEHYGEFALEEGVA